MDSREVLFLLQLTGSMSREEERFAQLRQKGFVDVDKWSCFDEDQQLLFDEDQQQELLAVLRNDQQATVLE